MQLKAFSIVQETGRNKFRIYIAAMPASQLIERCTIDRWTTKNVEGYQRLPDERRLSEGAKGSAVRYLMREMGCFPTSILLNVRGNLIFQDESDIGWCSYGELTVNDGERLWLIDGQHRIEALKRAIQRNPDFEKYPVIVSLMQLNSKFDELLLFYIVNQRQRSVPTDLAYRHLQRMFWEKGSEWLFEQEGRRGVRLGLATEIVDRLNENERSPWRGRITLVSEERRVGQIIRDKPIIRSIADVMRERVFQGMPISDLAELLIDFWNAVSSVYPEAFKSPQSYTLLASPGVFALHMLFPSVYSICARGGFIDEAGMERVLGRLTRETPGHPQPEFRGPIGLDFWSKEHGPAIANSTSLRMIRVLYLGLLEKIRLSEIS